ncbi:hypothetical protein DL96DRAFT_1757902 [Flagelloscypha sp. PMI_526]|nr:hypothetical protein DL96DRAFT_1757902 [Flagelloscypha sp. PMI_526]
MSATAGLAYQRKYNISSTELTILSRRLIESQPPKTTERFICYLLNGGDEVSNIARHTEKVVFWEAFKLDEVDMEKLYGEYEHASMFFVVMDMAKGKPAGVARIVKNSPAGFPTLNDSPKYIGVTLHTFKEYHKVGNLDTLWDLSTLAVLKDYRRIEENLVSNMLLRAMHVRAAYEGVEHYVAIQDKYSQRIFSSLGFIGEPIAGSGPVEHVGSTSSLFVYQHRQTMPKLIVESQRKTDRQAKSSAQIFKSRYVDGEGVDHRFMFQFCKDEAYDLTGKRYAKL